MAKESRLTIDVCAALIREVCDGVFHALSIEFPNRFFLVSKAIAETNAYRDAFLILMEMLMCMSVIMASWGFYRDWRQITVRILNDFQELQLVLVRSLQCEHQGWSAAVATMVLLMIAVWDCQIFYFRKRCCLIRFIVIVVTASMMVSLSVAIGSFRCWICLHIAVVEIVIFMVMVAIRVIFPIDCRRKTHHWVRSLTLIAALIIVVATVLILAMDIKAISY